MSAPALIDRKGRLTTQFRVRVEYEHQRPIEFSVDAANATAAKRVTCQSVQKWYGRIVGKFTVKVLGRVSP